LSRTDEIAALVQHKGFVSVSALSKKYDVSEVTIRRDLQQLEASKQIRRIHGGATLPENQTPTPPPALRNNVWVEDVDVLIASSLNPHADRLVMERTAHKGIPIISESIRMEGAELLIAVDDYGAAFELGKWVGEHCFTPGQTPNLLDLTYRLENTHQRSRGFIDGLCHIIPNTEVILSIDAHSSHQTAHQLTTDALRVHPQINIIFSINGATALGALDALKDRGGEGASLVTFGLEGNILRQELQQGGLLRAGVATLPEVMGPLTIHAALMTLHTNLPERLDSPHIVLTPENLSYFYQQPRAGEWVLDWEAIRENLHLPLNINENISPSQKSVGMVIPFVEHEWYQNLVAAMQTYADKHSVTLQVVDAKQHLQDEIVFRQRQIARRAYDTIQSGDVIMLDHGPINVLLSAMLAETLNITVVTNSMRVFENLKAQNQNQIILVGGEYDPKTETFYGQIAEKNYAELRADRLFLEVSGISTAFGLSETNTASVNVKQEMIRAAQHVVLLADHTRFGDDAMTQVGDLNIIHEIITDNGISASFRLEMMKRSIQMTLADL